MSPGENVGHGVEMAGAVLNSVIVSQELGDPFVLGWCADALVEHVLEWLVIGKDGELVPKQVWSPFFHGKKYRQHFFFICGQSLILG